MTPERAIHDFLEARLPDAAIYGGSLPPGWRGDAPAIVWTLASQTPAHGREPLSECTVYLSVYGRRDAPTEADDLSWAAYNALHGARREPVLSCDCVTRGMAAIDPDAAWPVARATYYLRLAHATAEEE